MFVIDVSEYQGSIDWGTVKGQIDGAILRVGYGSDITSQDDKYFKRNADECTRLGIPFGVYLYSYAQNISMAESEAQHVLRLINGYKLSYPVYYDMEDSSQARIGSLALGSMYKTFKNIIESEGYWCGIYANLYWFNNLLIDSRFSEGTRWLAQYSSTKGMDCSMWQYTSQGNINGISGNVDCNKCYYDFPNAINPKEEVYDMDKLVVYYGDADVFSAIPVSQKYHCPCMKLSDYEASGLKVKEVVQIGGKAEDKTRFDTFKNAGKLL